ncbi:rhamnogalacturonan acetylesterase [Rhizosphaericola mali]|uniref:Rhamnogalacturonan acetylesterase n=1 Tax=Rhizosphaericola mali TaxID=2545455 RepID=A0A5P2G4V7_9BACT|nr:rhamnogalacturonan acetylesterase [Rhizosphaericola mali]QES88800.1 rhamnogalacturonan acetylesterase [Rhizosphaericola mali]
MKKKSYFAGVYLMIIVVLAFVPIKKDITVYMIGDSTMSIKKPTAYPETGWGMEFPKYLKKGIIVKDYALNGRSTKSFRKDVDEKNNTIIDHWQHILDGLKPGDYVIIEFGHNDEKVEKPLIGTNVDEFKNNLIRYILETQSKHSIPILMTPIVRRTFIGDKLQDTHGKYADAVRFLADSLHVDFVDMQKLSSDLVGNLGAQNSVKLFNHVDSGHVNYPTGKKDDTHLNPEGAYQIAGLAAEGIKKLNIPLSQFVK